MRLVQIESPYSAETKHGSIHNQIYLWEAIRDCLKRNEAPFASHALYPQVLDDDDPVERSLGMEAGFAWMQWAKLVAVYVDLGISPGMSAGILRARQYGIPVEERRIEGWGGE